MGRFFFYKLWRSSPFIYVVSVHISLAEKGETKFNPKILMSILNILDTNPGNKCFRNPVIVANINDNQN